MYNLRHIEWVEIDSPLDFFMKRQFKLLPAVICCVCVDIKAMENKKKQQLNYVYRMSKDETFSRRTSSFSYVVCYETVLFVVE